MRLASDGAEAEALLRRFCVLSSAALAALERDDSSGLPAALDDREALMRQLGPLLWSLTATRARFANQPDQTSDARAVTATLASAEQSIRQAQAADAELLARVSACRSQLAEELDRLEQAELAVAAYNKPAGEESHRLDLLR